MTPVQTQYGAIVGTEENSIYLFRGIPYAKPPVGPLRFQPPAPPDSWDGTLEATAYGAMAPQPVAPSVLPSSNVTQSEDCLTLNVWTPGLDDAKRPVFVWIHGGGLTSGSGADFYCNGHGFAKDGDIVFVSINYRLGALGFLYLGHILGSDYQTSGNSGLLDVMAALRWVQGNIENFGGDASRVTVGGISAGSKLVASLFAAPQAADLFQGAILQSGAAQTVRDRNTATSITEELLGHLGLRRDEADKLLTLAPEEIVRAQQQLGVGARGLHLFGSVRDVVTLTDNPFEIVEGGPYGNATSPYDQKKPIPILLGTAREEFKLYTSLDPTLLRMEESTLRRMFGRNADAVLSAYRRLSLSMPRDEAAVQVLSDYVYSIASERFGDGLAQRGCPVWRYRFDWEGVYGASHAQDIPFVWNQGFEVDGFAIPESAKGLASAMHRAWIAFIRTGNPNTEELPTWPPYDVDGRQVMALNETSRVVSIPMTTVEPGSGDLVFVK